MAGVAQLVRASVCGTECRQFESGHPPHKIQARRKAGFNFMRKGQMRTGSSTKKQARTREAKFKPLRFGKGPNAVGNIQLRTGEKAIKNPRLVEDFLCLE